MLHSKGVSVVDERWLYIAITYHRGCDVHRPAFHPWQWTNIARNYQSTEAIAFILTTLAEPNPKIAAGVFQGLTVLDYARLVCNNELEKIIQERLEAVNKKDGVENGKPGQKPSASSPPDPAQIEKPEDLNQQLLKLAAQKNPTSESKAKLAQLRQLQVRGADLRACDADGNNGLHLAAMQDTDKTILDFFRNGGCNIDSVNNHGETPLFRAVTAGHPSTVTNLLTYAPDLSIKYKLGGKKAQDQQQNSGPQLITGKVEKDQEEFDFKEEEIKRDNDCGYHVLETTRDELADTLTARSNDNDARTYLAYEILNFFKEGRLGEHSAQARQLYVKWRAANEKEEADKLVRNTNDVLINSIPKFNRLSLEDLVEFLNDKPEYHAELVALQPFYKLEQEILVLCRSEETFKIYVGLGRDKVRHLWLGQRSACLYAESKGFSLRIWKKKNDKPTEVQLVESKMVSNSNKADVNAIFVDGWSHYNKLVVIAQRKTNQEAEHKASSPVKSLVAHEELSIFAYAIKNIKTPQACEVLHALLSGRGVNDKLPGEDFSPLHLSAKLGNVLVIKYLAEEMGADVNQGKPSAVICAALQGHEAALTALLEAGAQFDEKSEQGQQLLKQLSEVLDETNQDKIKKQLSSYSENQKQLKLLSDNLAKGIFLALFADVIIADDLTIPKTVHDLIRLVLVAMPTEIFKLSSKVRPEKLQKDEKAYSSHEKQFVPFLKMYFVPHGIKTRAVKKDWYKALGKDKGKQEIFKQTLETAIKNYVDKPSSELWAENIAHQVILGIQLKGVSAEYLKPIMVNALLGNKPLKVFLSKMPENKEALEKQLVNLIQNEISYSVEEHAEIREGDRSTFYELRVQIALEECLFTYGYLPDEEAETFKFANNVVKELKPYKNGKEGMVDKKVGLARHIIKIVLTKHEVFDFLEENPAKQKTFFDDLVEFLKSKRVQKMRFDQDRLDKVSKNVRAYKLYGSELNTKAHVWLSTQQNMGSIFSNSSRLSGSPVFANIEEDMPGEVKQMANGSLNNPSLDHPHLKTFIEELSGSLQNSLHEDRVIYQGKAGRRRDNLDRAIEVGAGAVDANGSALTSVLVNAARVGMGTVRDLYTDMYADRTSDFGRENIGKITGKAARLVAMRYRCQIVQLDLTDANGVKGLAHYFHNKAMDAVHICDAFKTVNNFWKWVCGNIRTLSPEDKLYLAMISDSGVSQVYLRKFHETSIKEHWDAKELILDCGFILQGKPYKKQKDSKHDKYGFCFSDDEQEIRQRGLVVYSEFNSDWMIKLSPWNNSECAQTPQNGLTKGP